MTNFTKDQQSKEEIEDIDILKYLVTSAGCIGRGPLWRKTH